MLWYTLDMVVYRIQSKQDRTRGAYWVHPFMSSKNECPRPTPDQDKGIERDPTPDEYCGFNSAAALIRWFRGEILGLIYVDGCEIVALHNVTVTAIGEYQVLFRWKN